MKVTKAAQNIYEKLFGSKPQPSTTDPEMLAILQNEIFGEVFSTGVLKDSTRELITVAVLAAMQTLPQLKAHTAAALNTGASPLEIRETVYMCAPFIGYPKTLNAVATANEVFADRGITLPMDNEAVVSYENRYDSGKQIQAPLYGDEIQDKFRDLPGDFSEFVPKLLTECCFGDFYTRRVLNVKTRELLALCILAAIHAENQLKAHVRGAYRSGNSILELTAALVQALPYIGFPYALDALHYICNLKEE